MYVIIANKPINITSQNIYPMITNKAISEIYKKYSRRPKSIDELNIALLFEAAHKDHAISVEGNNLIINSQESWSPFHTISLDRVHAILDFDKTVAVVLHSSIIFISKESDAVHIHLKTHKPSFSERLKSIIGR